LGTPPKYRVVTRELKFIFLHTLTCPQCRTGYNFMCNPFSKIWILTPLMWNCPIIILDCCCFLLFTALQAQFKCTTVTEYSHPVLHKIPKMATISESFQISELLAFGGILFGYRIIAYKTYSNQPILSWLKMESTWIEQEPRLLAESG